MYLMYTCALIYTRVYVRIHGKIIKEEVEL